MCNLVPCLQVSMKWILQLKIHVLISLSVVAVLVSSSALTLLVGVREVIQPTHILLSPTILLPNKSRKKTVGQLACRFSWKTAVKAEMVLQCCWSFSVYLTSLLFTFPNLLQVILGLCHKSVFRIFAVFTCILIYFSGIT